MTVTTCCYSCKRTITVPLEVFDVREYATCRDANASCKRRATR